MTGHSSFWDDLNENLKDPEFRKSYDETSRRVQEYDARMNGDDLDPRFCDGEDWDAGDHFDPWRCRTVWVELADGGRTGHQCAASLDHEGDHCCAQGHRCPQDKPRRSWRDRLLRRGGAR